MEIGHPSSILWCQRFFLLILFSIKKIFFREAIKKLPILWHRHNRWVGTCFKSNFFYRRNCDIYPRWAGIRHRCHNFIYPYFPSEFSIYHGKLWKFYPWLHGIRAQNENVLLMSLILCWKWGSRIQIKYDLCPNFWGVGG